MRHTLCRPSAACLLGLCLIVACALSGCHPAFHSPSAPRSQAPPLPLRGVTVILDPGHGGEDPGAVRVFGTEAAWTYRAAAEIGQQLQAQGATVLYTVRSRMLDPALCASEPPPLPPLDAVLAANGEPIRVRHSPRQLWERAAPARRAWNAAPPRSRAGTFFFLSLHMDDSPDPDVRGSLVCVDRRRPVPALGLALARILTRDGFARVSERADGQPGLSLRRLGVLNPLYNPVPQSALLEMTTLSNFDNSLQAAAPAWRLRMAARITEAIDDARRTK